MDGLEIESAIFSSGTIVELRLIQGKINAFFRCPYCVYIIGKLLVSHSVLSQRLHVGIFEITALGRRPLV